ncbi:hypothetical protein GAYE_SCF07G2832 [Galdieria yellowstonensis]|uniref:Uncharacterized protein n=1 Tax=Galdieria yellowstonensis TaxID=3028027 RepID=A0AAV9IC92_9RHOD|nr:hypothetical protein GAYE_SCF07G2832 [Galdieria yellowstonensis]
MDEHDKGDSLESLLEDLWNTPLSVTFRNDYLEGALKDKNVTKPRCPAGSLIQVAQMPDEEDSISIVHFDEKLLKKAFLPSSVSILEPFWIQKEQPLHIASHLKKAHKRKSKRKRQDSSPTDIQVYEQKKKKTDFNS